MAGNLCGTNRTTGHDSTRDCPERRSARGAFTFVLVFGLSDLKLIFDDEEENFKNRERVLERLTQVTLPPGVTPQMGTDWSPVGQIYFFTLHSTNPRYDVMELKALEDWVVEKNLKSVP